MKLSELKLNERNPRQIKGAAFEKLKKSVKELPKMMRLRPIVIDTDGVILGGNMRYRALQALGYSEIPNEWVKVADDLTDEEKQRFIIEDNVQFGEWDFDMLFNEWDTPSLEDWGVEIPEIAKVAERGEISEDDFREDTDEVQTRCKLGDIWQLGEHRLVCGDATKSEDVARLMNGEGADLFLTDPPYNVNYEGDTKDKLTILNDNMGDERFRGFLIDAFIAANEVLRTGGAIYIWHAGLESYNFCYAFKAAGWKLSEVLIWVKNTLALGRQDYQWKHEPCLYGWKEGAAHYFCDSRVETTTIEDERQDFSKMKKDELVKLLEEIYSDKTETTVLYEKKPALNAEHPTMKPVKLMGRLIRNSTKKGDKVLDTFGGSGSTLIACEQLNRKCFTMELDPHYCDVIIARWEKLTGQVAERLSK